VPRTKTRTPALRDRVLAVAIDRLAGQGAAGFTTRAIAHQAETSTPAVYELFGDKSGLLREVFFEGFRVLRRNLDTVADTGDPVADLRDLISIYRRFMRENPALADVMFSRPFTDFDPGPSEQEASGSVRTFIVDRVARCIDDGQLRGEATDVAHVIVALVQGLAGAEKARRLGTTKESVDRRFELAVDALLAGLGPPA
jgi:AcrR family transcriptional regulator